MQLRCYFFCLFFIHISLLYSSEYIYPVAYLESESTILYINQRSPQAIELFQWNYCTNTIEQVLWSRFNAAGLQLLPNKKGFSFIDNGRLRVKRFEKRSPKTIDFDEPLYNINSLYWITEYICYCSAQQSDNVSLFELHDDGTCYCLRTDDQIDFLYPQKKENQLFYIERNRLNASYRIIQTEYSTYENKKYFDIIADFQDKPIIFLHMISLKEGFVVEHEKTISSAKKAASFSYYHLTKKGDSWVKNILFTFTIPTYLFLYDNEQRLFESILPLLPRVINNKIYFSNYINNYLEPYCYDLTTTKIDKVYLSNKKGHVFVPIQCGTQLCYGGTKDETNLLLSVF